jgi:DNA polymerase
VAWICGALPLLQQFRDRLDPYAIMGGLIFGYEVDPKVHLLERFIGKTAILGLGYGCGATKFYNMVIMLARTLGIDLGTMWTMELAQQSVDTYRTVNAPIQYSWRELDRAIRTAWLGKGTPFQFLPCTIEYGEVKLPSGLSLKYDRPAFDFETSEHTYFYGKLKRKIYGAALLENIVQALARIVVMNAALRIADRGYNYALQAHDELVYVVPTIDLDKAKQIIHEEMVRPPSWAPDLPLTASIGSGPNYGEAK